MSFISKGSNTVWGGGGLYRHFSGGCFTGSEGAAATRFWRSGAAVLNCRAKIRATGLVNMVRGSNLGVESSLGWGVVWREWNGKEK